MKACSRLMFGAAIAEAPHYQTRGELWMRPWAHWDVRRSPSMHAIWFQPLMPIHTWRETLHANSGLPWPMHICTIYVHLNTAFVGRDPQQQQFNQISLFTWNILKKYKQPVWPGRISATVARRQNSRMACRIALAVVHWTTAWYIAGLIFGAAQTAHPIYLQVSLELVPFCRQNISC
jgi:hypothetical protein